MSGLKELQAGERFGNYLLEKRLGEGGWGEVWLARHARLAHKPPVAIKFVLRPRAMELDRFEREVAILDKLRDNFYIIKADDYGQQDGIPYLVMEYAPGGNLSERMREGLALGVIAEYLRQAANALDFAHSLGVIHRDLKPSNILFSAENTLLLADFGIAHDDEYEMTETGIGMGTAEYMAPEQFTDAKHVGCTADIYSLGIIAYQMLTGKLPFGSRKTGKSLYQLMTDHLNQPVPPLQNFDATLPPTLQLIIEKALAKEPENRYQTAGEFAADFKAALPAFQTGEIHIAPSAQEETIAIPPSATKHLQNTPTPSIPSVSPTPASGQSATPSPSLPAYVPVTPAPIALHYTPATPTPVTPASYTPTPPQPYFYPNYQARLPRQREKSMAGLRVMTGFAGLILTIAAVLTVILLNRPASNKNVAANLPANSITITAITNSFTPAPIGSVNVSTSGDAVIVSLSGSPNPANVAMVKNVNIPVYPGARKYEVTPGMIANATKQYEAMVGFFNEGRIEGYITTAEGSKVKSFFKEELEKAGWQDITALLVTSLGYKELAEQLNSVGGFSLIYRKGDITMAIGGLPAPLAKAMNLANVNQGELVISISVSVIKV